MGEDSSELDSIFPPFVSTHAMATTINKQKIVNQLFTALGKHAKNKPLAERPVLEQFLYAILRENTTRDAADQAFKSLQDRFFDWNEVRVSSTMEIAEAFDGDGRRIQKRGRSASSISFKRSSRRPIRSISIPCARCCRRRG